MAEYLIQSETLAGIADAIRGKTGGTDPVAVSDMAAQIEGIPAGGGGDIDARIDGSITEISSNVTDICGHAFYNCGQLKVANFPMATRVRGQAFRYCSRMETVNFPAVTTIESNAFQNCTSLSTVSFPAATAIQSTSFSSCSSLQMADFPAATSFSSSVFYGCTKLTALILRSNTKPTLANTSAFTETPIESGTGYIDVPSALIEDYKVATNWSTYAAQFRALEDYTVDGTVTGELDETKI